MVKDRRTFRIVWLLILLAAFLYRQLTPHFFLYVESSDMPSYLVGATALLSGQWDVFPIFRTPGYSIFIALVFALGQLLHFAPSTACQIIVELQSVMVMATGWFAADLYRRLFKQDWPALIVFSLIVFSPVLFLYERYFLSETFYLFCFTLAIWLSYQCLSSQRPQNYLLAGLAWITAGMTRPIGLVTTVLFGVVLGLQRAWRNLVLFMLPVILISAMWIGFNVQQNQYWGFATGLPLNQLLKLVDYIDYDSNTLPEVKRQIHERYIHYAPKDPERYMAVNQGLWASNHGLGRNKDWVKYNEQSSVLLSEIWRKNPWGVIGKTVSEMGAMLTTPGESEPLWGWPIFLLVSMGTLGFLWVKSKIQNQKAFVGWVLLAISSQLLVYPMLVFWQVRFRYALEPTMCIFFVYGLWSLGAACCLRLQSTAKSNLPGAD